MKSVNAIIVDDEELARLNLSEAIKKFSHWTVVAELSSSKHLVDTINQHKADVLFLDINMPGESGIDAAKQIALQAKKVPHIVFVTAFEDFAIQAFELYALDYLLKPFDTERFEQCVSRIDKLVTNETGDLSSYERFLNNEYIDRVVIKSIASIRVIDVENIFWLGTNGNYIEVHHTEGCHLHRGSLSNLLNVLDPVIFCRVHRQAVVNLTHARELKSTSDSKNTLHLANGDNVSVSENYKKALLKHWAY